MPGSLQASKGPDGFGWGLGLGDASVWEVSLLAEPRAGLLDVIVPSSAFATAEDV